MQVSALTSLAQPVETGQTQAAPRDEFLRLLVAQLQHQDPLQPQDGAAFVAQLAQFASLEQIAETNARLGSIEAGQAASVRAGFTNLVGKEVSARTDQFVLPGSAEVGHAVHLGADTSKTDVVIYDSAGKAVRRIPLGARGKGDVEFTWDGKSDDGVQLADGKYRIEVEAVGAGGGDVETYALVRGLVSAVEFGEDGTVSFRVGEATITPADIISIGR